MAEVAHVLVVLGRAGEAERVVAADGVTDDLDERLEVVVEELGVEPGGGVRVAHQRPRGRCVEAALLAFLKLRCAEREEVGALATLDVDHLDVLTGLHLVGERRGAIDLEVEARVGERIGESKLGAGRVWPGARDLELEVGGGSAALDHRRPGGRGHLDDGVIALRGTSPRRPGVTWGRRARPPRPNP